MVGELAARAAARLGGDSERDTLAYGIKGVIYVWNDSL